MVIALEELSIKNVGKNLRAYRKMNGYSQRKLADMATISESYLKGLEGGSKTPSLSTFVSICLALNIPADLLLKDEGYRLFSDYASDYMLKKIQDFDGLEHKIITESISSLYQLVNEEENKSS